MLSLLSLSLVVSLAKSCQGVLSLSLSLCVCVCVCVCVSVSLSLSVSLILEATQHERVNPQETNGHHLSWPYLPDMAAEIRSLTGAGISHSFPSFVFTFLRKSCAIVFFIVVHCFCF